MVRRRLDVGALAVGAAVALGLGLVCHHLGLTAAETGVFRVFNDLPGSWSGTVQALARLGTTSAAVWLVVLCLVLLTWRAARDVALTCVVQRLASQQAKGWTGRGRPLDLLDDVAVHGHLPGGFGYPSGHTGMAAALATAVAPHLPARLRWIPVAAVVLVASARLYVGAHLPLDVVGGAALGLAVGSAVHLLLGVEVDGGAPDADRSVPG